MIKWLYNQYFKVSRLYLRVCCSSLKKFKVTLVKNLYFLSRKKGRTLWQFSRYQHNHFHSTLNQSSSIGFFNVQWIGRCEAGIHSAALQNGHIRSAVIFAPSMALLIWDIPAFMFYLNCPQEFEIFVVVLVALLSSSIFFSDTFNTLLIQTKYGHGYSRKSPICSWGT